MGPYPFGRTLWRTGVQYARNLGKYRTGGPFGTVSDQHAILLANSPGTFSVRGTFSRRCSRKWIFRPQQFVQRNCFPSGLLSLHYPKRLATPRTAIAFHQSGHRLPALHKTLRRQHLTEGIELQNDHVAYAEGIDNLPTVSSPCSWPTTATHAVMRSILIDD